MKTLKCDWTEQKCPACDGTGFPQVTQPTEPGRKIYPPPCTMCNGMGRIRVVNNG